MAENGKVNTEKAPFLPKTSPCEKARVGHAIAVLSGKGGVGKSFTSCFLAVKLRRMGYKVGILDADITGPSVPYAFGVKGPVVGDNAYFYPVKTKSGIEVMSSNLLLPHNDDPIVWRGPMLSTLIEQFYTEVVWDVDYLIIDMPPGTADVSLTIFQKIRLSSAVIVASPQGLVDMIVEKSAKMAEMLSVPLLSLVENMAYVRCPDCGRRIDIYGKGNREIAKKHGIPVFEEIPFDERISSSIDEAKIEDLEAEYLDRTAQAIVDTALDSEKIK